MFIEKLTVNRRFNLGNYEHVEVTTELNNNEKENDRIFLDYTKNHINVFIEEVKEEIKNLKP